MKKISKLLAALLVGCGLLSSNGAFAQAYIVTDTGPGGVRYKMEQSGDLVPRFYINNQLIARRKWQPYAAEIDRLMKALWLKQTHHPFTKNPDMR
jgi:hypothetical protein